MLKEKLHSVMGSIASAYFLLLSVSVLTFTFAVNAFALSNSTLNGQYYGVSFYADNWTCFGSGFCDGNGSLTYQQIQTSDGILENGQESYSVSPDGAFTMGNNRGVVSPDGNLAFVVDLAGTVGMDILVKKSSGLSNATLNGQYYWMQFSEDDGQTLYGSCVFDGKGSATYQIIQASDGELGSGKEFFTVSPDGECLSGNKRGVVSPDGNFAFLVSGTESELLILVKKSSGLSNAILNGEYYDVNFFADDWTGFTNVAFDGKGSATYQAIQTSDGELESGQDFYSVSSDGAFTVGDNRGVVSPDGNFVFMVDLSGTVGMDILTKKSLADDDPGDFDEEQYLLNNPDVAQAVYDGYFASGWEHYDLYGRAEGRSYAAPSDSGDFNEAQYLLNNPDVAQAVYDGYFASGWEHYNAYGRAEGRSYAAPSDPGDFNEAQYLLNNPDVAQAIYDGYFASGWEHYNAYGRAEGRSYAAPSDPGDFNEAQYLLNNPDVAQAVYDGYFASGWEHYNAYGRAEGRSYAAPSDPGDFNEAQYLLNNPDVAQAVYDGYFASGWEHYDLYGRAEGRSYAAP